MKHANTKTIMSYWDSRRRAAPAPARADITPQDLAGLLSHIFMLKRIDSNHHVFCLAGDDLCKLHRREFREQNFLSLWSGHDRVHMSALLEGALAEPAPARAMIEAYTLDNRKCDIELTLLPLRGQGGWLNRILGLYQPLDGFSLGGRPVIRHRLNQIFPAKSQLPDLMALSAKQNHPIFEHAANDL